jgi:hypothetical protein
MGATTVRWDRKSNPAAGICCIEGVQRKILVRITRDVGASGFRQHHRPTHLCQASGLDVSIDLLDWDIRFQSAADERSTITWHLRHRLIVMQPFYVKE